MSGALKKRKKAILDRIRRLEDETANGRQSLESSDHAGWRGFRPSFRAIVAIGFVAVCFVALYVAIQHALKIASRPSGSEIQFRIVTKSGQPVVGAVVSPRSFFTSDPQGEIEEMRRHMRGRRRWSGSDETVEIHNRRE